MKAAAKETHTEGSEPFARVAASLFFLWLIVSACPRLVLLLVPPTSVAALRDGTALFLVLAATLAGVNDKGMRRLRPAALIAGLSWVAWISAAALTSDSFLRGVATFRWYLLYPAFFLIGAMIGRHLIVLRRCSAALLVVGLLNAAVGVAQFLTDYAFDVGAQVYAGEDLILANVRFGESGATGLLGNRPGFGLFMAAALALAASSHGARWGQLPQCFLIATFLVAGVLSLSRTAWLALAAALLVGLWTGLPSGPGRKRNRSRLAVAGLAVAAWPLLNLLFRSGGIRAGASEVTTDRTFSGRTNLWAGIWDRLGDTDPLDRLFGYGLGSVGRASFFADREGIVPTADSVYVHILVEAGLVGLVLGLLLVLYFSLRQREQMPYLITILVAGFAVDVTAMPYPSGVFAFLLGQAQVRRQREPRLVERDD